MQRQTNKLSDTGLRRTTFKEGLHADGAGLYLRVSKAGAKSWVCIYVRRGKRTELGLGGYPATSLANAREKARLAKEQLAQGLDPMTERRKESAPTLRILTDRFIAEFGHTVVPIVAKRWFSLMTIHAAPMMNLHVDHITTNDVIATLKKTQKTNPTSARHLRGVLGRIFDYAKVLGFRADNPAVWQSHLALVMAPLGAPTTHRSAVPYKDCPALFAKLNSQDTRGDEALRFLMLTATRTKEVTDTTWAEIDLVARIWTIPARRTKNRREFRIPLSDAAMIILVQRLIATGVDAPDPAAFVFGGRGAGRPVSPQTMLDTLGRVTDEGYTVHGFRSSFRQWAGEETEHPSDILERCLNHVIGSEVQRAYDRADYLERRRVIMDEWAAYLGQTPGQQSDPRQSCNDHSALTCEV